MKKILNGNKLKFIAIISMLIDHLYKVGIIEKNILFMMIGRLAFPIFAFLIAEGMIHTSNKIKYIRNIFIFAIISEIPYDIVFFHSPLNIAQQNIMWTFLISAGTIFILEKTNKQSLKTWQPLILTLSIILGGILRVDYFIFGIILVILFYFLQKNKDKYLFYILRLTSIMLIFNLSFWFLGDKNQIFSMLAIIPILAYDGTRGKKSEVIKYTFYIFYPIHLLIIIFIERLLK